MTEIKAGAPEGKNSYRHITYIFLKNIVFLGYSFDLNTYTRNSTHSGSVIPLSVQAFTCDKRSTLQVKNIFKLDLVVSLFLVCSVEYYGTRM
jgi:hypothetical protein